MRGNDNDNDDNSHDEDVDSTDFTTFQIGGLGPRVKSRGKPRPENNFLIILRESY